RRGSVGVAPGFFSRLWPKGLPRLPRTPPELRASIPPRLQTEGVAALYADLSARDPHTARRLMPADRARIVRALEVISATGRSLSDWHRDGMQPVLHARDAVQIFLAVDRAELYRRIDVRFDAMLAAGVLE